MTVVHQAFVSEGLLVHCGLLLPSKQLPAHTDTSKKYLAICSSIADVGLIEPLSVSAADRQSGQRLILDGHVRLAALRQLGIENAMCLEARDNETYTYNSRVNRLSTVQEHQMLRRAVERGVSPERLSRALDVNLEVLRRKVTLLDGISPEAAELMKDRQFSPALTQILRKMRPARQLMCVELMVSANSLTLSYAKGLLYATPQTELVGSKVQRPPTGVSADQLARLQGEARNLQDRYKAIEQDYGQNVLNLTVACGYVSKLLSNPAVTRHLRKRYPELLIQLELIVESTSMQN